MVKVHDLSVLLVIALHLDLLSYKARVTANLTQGQKLPGTEFGWLKKHFSDNKHNRNNGILQATRKYNRSRGLPVDTPVFASPHQYANCLLQVEVNEEGEVVYRGANDSAWEKIIRK